MRNILADLTVGRTVSLNDVDYTCLSRCTLDSREEMVVLHDRRLDLEHPAALRTFFLSRLIDLDQLGCLRIISHDVPQLSRRREVASLHKRTRTMRGRSPAAPPSPVC